MIKIGLADVALARGHSFISSALSDASIVIDAGAHKNEFASDVLRRFECKVVAIEPNGDLDGGHLGGKVQTVSAALSSRQGRSAFVIGENSESSHLSPGGGIDQACRDEINVETVTLSAILNKFQIETVDLMKLDIEGAEYDVLLGIDGELSGRIKQITVEFHPAQSLDADWLRYREVLEHLSDLGFLCLKASFSGIGDVLFINTRYFETPTKLVTFLLPFYRKFLEYRSRHWDT